jgi:hypothetical protein
MQNQNFSNHSRMHPFYHYFILPLALVGIAAGLLHTFMASGPDRIIHASIALAFFLLFCVAGLTRIYSLKVQDRVIRSEENFRHFLLTGKPLPQGIRLRQIIAIRFASDEEFPELVKRAVEEKLSAKEIKSAIKIWRADYNRI